MVAINLVLTIKFHITVKKPNRGYILTKAKEQASLIGFIKSCKMMESCELDENLKTLFENKSTKKLPKEMIKKIEDLSLYDFGLVKQNKSLHFIKI